MKYDDRPDASRIVAAQNEREWYLRRLGLDVVCYGWTLATSRRGELGARFAALLRDNPAHPLVEGRSRIRPGRAEGGRLA